jgi:hypothetical protein
MTKLGRRNNSVARSNSNHRRHWLDRDHHA